MVLTIREIFSPRKVGIGRFVKNFRLKNNLLILVLPRRYLQKELNTDVAISCKCTELVYTKIFNTSFHRIDWLWYWVTETYLLRNVLAAVYLWPYQTCRIHVNSPRMFLVSEGSNVFLQLHVVARASLCWPAYQGRLDHLLAYCFPNTGTWLSSAQGWFSGYFVFALWHHII